jgi:hypothetical protein
MRQLADSAATAFSVLWELFWAIALGLIALWAFFLVMGAVSVGDPAWLTVSMGVLAALAAIHFAHVRRALADHEHSDLARRVHMLRERRGF